MSEVVMLRWPDDQGARERLAAAGRPRLLVVAAHAAPPVVSDALEDWIREPASELDLRVRIEGIRVRAAHALAARPEVDDDGVIRFRDRWAPLPPVEARLSGVLVSRFGAVVSRQELTAAGWPGRAPGRNALDVHVLRLRRRLQPVRLAIRTIRSRGYLLEAGQATS